VGLKKKDSRELKELYRGKRVLEKGAEDRGRKQGGVEEKAGLGDRGEREEMGGAEGGGWGWSKEKMRRAIIHQKKRFLGKGWGGGLKRNLSNMGEKMEGRGI